MGRGLWLSILLSATAAAQPLALHRGPSVSSKWFGITRAYVSGPISLCLDVRMRPTSCAYRSLPKPRPTLPAYGYWADSTVAIGTWNGEPVRLRIVLTNRKELGLAEAFVMALRPDGSLVDTLSTEASPLVGIWRHCHGGHGPDLDGDGIAEVGIAAGIGGGPYSVNVAVTYVRFDPVAGRLTFWPDDGDGYPAALTTPRLSADGRRLTSHHRDWGMGRAWSILTYRLPADSLVEVSRLHYHVLPEVEVAGLDEMVYERTFQTGARESVSIVRGSDIPDAEQEWFGC